MSKVNDMLPILTFASDAQQNEPLYIENYNCNFRKDPNQQSIAYLANICQRNIYKIDVFLVIHIFK